MATPNPFGRGPFDMTAQAAARPAYDMGLRSYLLGVYNYMASALALTGVVALAAAQSPVLMHALYGIDQYGHAGLTGLGWLVVIAPLFMVFGLSMGIQRMKVSTAKAVFWSYAALMGLSLSSIFLVYTGASIARVFFITAAMFGGMSLYGYTTKRDMTGMGSFMLMGLIGIIIASVVNIFLHSTGLQFAVSVIGVFIFLGLTAYDTQKLKGLYYQTAGNAEAAARTSILGALSLYLDFINLFMMLMRFMGNRR